MVSIKDYSFYLVACYSFFIDARLIGLPSKSLSRQSLLVGGYGAREGEGSLPGVGFDLSASYGTVAISYPNGTNLPIAIVEATEGYNDVIQRLSFDSSRHLSPPYQNPGDSWSDAPRQAARKARKAIGLPASEDVGHLASMIIALRDKVEEATGQAVSSAGVTTLNLAALYQEDLRDAFEYAKISVLGFPVRYDVLYETSAAYAGYGYGLCVDYTRKEQCKEEQQKMDSEVVMAVLYTSTVLTVSLSVTKSAYYLYEPDTRHFSDFSLGSDARNNQVKGGEGGYWDAVEDALQKIMVENPYFERPAKVLLLGGDVRDKDFRFRLERVLRSQMKSIPKILSEDPEFIAAIGVAEMTKRLPWDPYRS